MDKEAFAQCSGSFDRIHERLVASAREPATVAGDLNDPLLSRLVSVDVTLAAAVVVAGRSLPVFEILSNRRHPKMIKTDAPRLVAKMIYDHARRDRSIRLLPYEAVDVNPATIDPKLTITSACSPRRPEPTPVTLSVIRGESGARRGAVGKAKRVTVETAAAVMAGAEAVGVDRPKAASDPTCGGHTFTLLHTRLRRL